MVLRMDFPVPERVCECEGCLKEKERVEEESWGSGLTREENQRLVEMLKRFD